MSANHDAGNAGALACNECEARTTCLRLDPCCLGGAAVRRIQESSPPSEGLVAAASADGVVLSTPRCPHSTQTKPSIRIHLIPILIDLRHIRPTLLRPLLPHRPHIVQIQDQNPVVIQLAPMEPHRLPDIDPKLPAQPIPADPLPSMPPPVPGRVSVLLHRRPRRPQPYHRPLPVKQQQIRIRLPQRLMRKSTDHNIPHRIQSRIQLRPPRLLRLPRTLLPLASNIYIVYISHRCTTVSDMEHSCQNKSTSRPENRPNRPWTTKT